jgi:peroxiredoxin
LSALQQLLADIRSLGADLVAISPELPDSSHVTAEKNNLTFHVLSDVGNEVAKKFGLVFQLPPDLREMYKSLGIDLPAHNGDQSYELPLPATYVIARDGVIQAVFADADYVKRMEPADILAALRGGGRSERRARAR